MPLAHLLQRTDLPADALAVILAAVEERSGAPVKIQPHIDVCRSVVDGLSSPVWRAGADGKCDYFNRAWLEFTGRSMDEELGDGWTEGVHPDDLGGCLALYGEALQQGTPFTLEYRLRRHDGAYRWFIDHGRPILNADGTLRGYIGTCSDVHDQHAAKEALRESEARFRGVFEQAAVGIGLTSLDGRFLRVNQRLCESVGRTEAELMDLTIRDISHPDDLESDLALLRQLGAGTVTAHSFETRCLRADGETVWLDLTVSAIPGAGGRPEAFVGIVQDITGRKAAQNRLDRELAFTKAMSSASQELIASSFSVDVVSGILLEAARTLTGSTMGFVGIIDPETKDLVKHTLSLADGTEPDPQAEPARFPCGEDGRVHSP